MQGLHLIADLRLCRADAPEMTDPAALAAALRDAVGAAGLREVGCSFHGFEGGGVTGVILLAESHVAVHTWPEHGAVALDIYVCNVQADHCAGARGLLARLAAGFGAQVVAQREVRRLDPTHDTAGAAGAGAAAVDSSARIPAV